MDGPHIGRRTFLATGWSLGLGALGFAAPGRAQGRATTTPGIRVGPIRRVGAQGVKYIEPWLCANPHDAKNLIIAGSVYVGPAPKGDVRTTGEVRYTVDSGQTWCVGDLPGMAEFREKPGLFLDTYATFAPDGTAFVEFLGGSGDHPDLWTYRPRMAAGAGRARPSSAAPSTSLAWPPTCIRVSPASSLWWRPGASCRSLLPRVLTAGARSSGRTTGPGRSRPSTCWHRRRSCTSRTTRRSSCPTAASW